MESLPSSVYPPCMETPVGVLLRDWRTRRRMSQLDLATEIDMSSRHLSFVETGRSQPSRSTILRIVDRLDVPLDARNEILAAGGFAPLFRVRDFYDEDLSAVRAS